MKHSNINLHYALYCELHYPLFLPLKSVISNKVEDKVYNRLVAQLYTPLNGMLTRQFHIQEVSQEEKLL